MFKYSFVMTVYDRKMLIQSKRSVAEMNFIKISSLSHSESCPILFVVINHSWITAPILPLVIVIKSSTAIVICIVRSPPLTLI